MMNNQQATAVAPCHVYIVAFTSNRHQMSVTVSLCDTIGILSKLLSVSSPASTEHSSSSRVVSTCVHSYGSILIVITSQQHHHCMYIYHPVVSSLSFEFCSVTNLYRTSHVHPHRYDDTHQPSNGNIYPTTPPTHHHRETCSNRRSSRCVSMNRLHNTEYTDECRTQHPMTHFFFY